MALFLQDFFKVKFLDWFVRLFIFLIFVPLSGKVTLNFSNTGTSMQVANSTGSGWASTGQGFRTDEIPMNLELARRVQLGFPVSGWESEHSGTTWKLSPWLGTYEPTSAPWVYHESLGWIYFHQADLDSIWVWKDELGWVWTNQDLFPYLHQNLPEAWLALNPETARPTLLFDFPNNTWFTIEKPSINLALSSSPENGGTIDGLRKIDIGENLALFARPNNGFIFSNWEGSYNTSENPILIDKLLKGLSLTAVFKSVDSVLNSSNPDSILSHLSSQDMQNKALLELALNGQSSLLSNPLTPTTFDSELESFIQASGRQTSLQTSLIFNDNSAVFTHPYAPLAIGNKLEVYLDGPNRGIIKQNCISIESIYGVRCLKVELSFPNGEVKKRWLAQDTSENVWLVQSHAEGLGKSDPFVLLPKELVKGWKSWSDFSLIPTSYAIHFAYPIEVYAQGIGTFKNCVETLIYRSPHHQNEYYSPGVGLIKISLP